MLAAYASAVNPDDPFAALSVGEIEPPDVPEDWTRVSVAAASLNHHDLWSLAGVGLRAEQCPMILGTDAVGRTETGHHAVVYPVIGDAALDDETLDPKRTLLSEVHPGTLAEYVSVPERNLVPAPPGWTAAEAACLPTTFLTAWRMLTTRGRLPADGAVLVQGTGGGVATAAILLAKALGARVYATGRDPERRERAAAIGAVPVEAGGRLPERMDVVIDSVGAPVMSHSVKSLKPGGRLVSCGVTGGPVAEVDMRHVFFKQLEILGSTMGTRDELVEVVRFCAERDVRPVIDATFALADAEQALRRLASGEAFGKVVLVNE
ncbi:zinc-binding dehydrogenase [Glycomyces algeriensis]|uniref:Zn-dependent oxidoreductase n=1 Tax=Glycomyces algeriensis TaxID=256037 RepID=A0A9W6G841_9ACTN|nr:zinc-binding dehydrogenase [Glycomyces algeriensis]MDA1368808.1 zinc-binding dehydrogenase [Glycomyces algeriensis]MDR7349428.1 NADPH:quinone reductase-like Zn-dependent oxidoreductase [Glycomyces algeriensis]GLI42131.1 Zn-dependent oxidoreductase [Glycomyces algeriensis]